MTQEHDFELSDHGSIAMIRPLTDAAQDWLDENVSAEGWQWMGGALCVAPIYAMNIVEGFVRDGLTAPGSAEVVFS